MTGAAGRGLRLGVAALATAAVAEVLLGGAPPARAAAPAREAAAAAMRARVGPAPGATPDRDAVLGAWEAAGARLDPVRRHLAVNSGPGALEGATLLFADLCGPDLALPADVPEPGDLLLYREPATAAGARWRVAMLTGPVTAVILEPRSHRLEEVERGRLLDDLPTGPEPRLVSAGTLRACRFSAALVPGGEAGAEVATPGQHRRIALVDAGEAVRGLRWEFDHPRDADTGTGHRLLRLVTTPLALVAEGTALLLGAGARSVGWLLGALGPTPLTAAWQLLGSSFDGRRLHALLTEAVLAQLLGPVPAILGHLAPGAALTHILHSAASFAVSTVTGIDDSEHVLVGGVLLALVCDAMVVGKPLAVAGRLGLGTVRAAAGPGIATLHHTLDLSSRASDLVSGRPSALLRLAGIGGSRQRRLHDLLDGASLLLRPSSIPGHLVELSGRVARWSHSAAAGAASTPPTERALAAALRHPVAERLLGHVEQVAELSHLHSGARTLTAAASGGLQPFGSNPPPPPPIHLPTPDR